MRDVYDDWLVLANLTLIFTVIFVRLYAVFVLVEMKISFMQCFDALGVSV